jgi:hypothetical protein
MADTNCIQTASAQLKKAIKWLSESVREHPETDREHIIRQAGIRFDLTPKECQFLQNNFTHKGK